MKILRGMTAALSVAAIFALSGCGGGDGDDAVVPAGITNSQLNLVNGTVAVGRPVRANVTMYDSNGESIEAVSDSDGHYTVNVGGMQPPFLVRAQILETGDYLFSFGEGDSDVINVTPITSYVVGQAARTAGVGGASQALYAARSGGV